jgi:CheY-like chemotaxis protein
MKGKSILLVEDDDLDVICVERSLKKIGGNHKLHIAYNGIEALYLLREGKINPMPDIIILDLYMPVMNGIDFLKNLRKDKKFDTIKIFVMTISTEEKERSTALDLGVSDYYIKPLNFSDNNKRSASMDSFMHFYISKMLN